MPSNIRGTLFPLLQSETWDFDPYRGVIYKASFRGLSLANMDALRIEYTRNNVSCLMHTEKGVTNLEVNDNTNTFTLDTWQIVGNEERYDVFSHPTVGVITNGSDDMIAAIRAGIENIPTSTTLSTAIEDIFKNTAFSNLTAPQKTILGRFVGLNLRGSTDYRKSQYVLRHTTNAPNTYSANIADINIDFIYDRATLLTETTNVGLWIQPLPNRLQYKINAIPAPTARQFYYWGWLKSSSTETLAAYNRIEICTEYTLEQWSTDEYPNIV